MMDLSLLTAAAESARAAFGLAKGAAAAAVDHEVKAKLIDVQSAILEIQEKLGNAQAERLDLLHQLAELRDKVREFEGAKAALDKYELFEINPGNFVYQSKAHEGGEPAHFACPRCYNEGKVALLQAGRGVQGAPLLRCPSCKFNLVTGAATSPPRRVGLLNPGYRP